MQNRNRALLDDLYRRYRQRLTSFLTRRRFTPDEAADLVQETYRRIHETTDVESIQSPQAFLFRVAANLARNDVKRRRVVVGQGCVDAQSEQLAAEDPTAYRVLKGRQELSIVREALMELSPKCRRVFVLNRFEGRSYARIAEETGVSVSMIEKYMSQALAHLRERLAEAEHAVAKTRRSE